MFRKMIKSLVNNAGLKVLSILLSIVLWMVVVKLADPDMTKTFSVSVDILNKDVVAEMGKVPDVVGDTDIAVFYITGPRSYVEKMNGDDFNVTADLSQLDLRQDGDTKLVPIEISARKYDRYITINQRTVNLQITLEDLSEQKFVITAEATGTPAEGCAIGNVEVTPNLLNISGPESIVSRISRVSASINVDGVSSDVSDNVVPVLYDEDNTPIASDLLEMNQSAVTIRANILGTKSVPVRCQISGTPAEGYEYRGLEYTPDSVLIKGEAEVLNGISAINIPEDVINIDGAREESEVSIDITPYLAEAGVSLVDDTANQIVVRVLIEQKETKVFNIPVEKIQITGLNQDYELTYSGSSVPVSVRALKEHMDTLEIGSISASADVTNLEPGSHTIELTVTLPGEQFEQTETARIQITIEDKNAGPETEQDETQENAGGSEEEEEDNNGNGNAGNGNNRDSADRSARDSD